MSRAKSTTRKLSRRQAVTLLGSGVVMLRPGAGEEPVTAATADACAAVQPIKGPLGTATSSGVSRAVVLGNPCCQEGMEAFFTGFNHVKGNTKAHLKDFAAALQDSRGELEEYCVMVWGLKKEDSDHLREEMQARYTMREYVPGKK
jgi:hypothetical protein